MTNENVQHKGMSATEYVLMQKMQRFHTGIDILMQTGLVFSMTEEQAKKVSESMFRDLLRDIERIPDVTISFERGTGKNLSMYIKSKHTSTLLFGMTDRIVLGDLLIMREVPKENILYKSFYDEAMNFYNKQLAIYQARQLHGMNR